MDRLIRHPLSPVQQREENGSVGAAEGPPQRLQPTRVPRQGARQQPHPLRSARVDNQHARGTHAATPQPAAYVGPRNLHRCKISSQLVCCVRSQGPAPEMPEQAMPGQFPYSLSQSEAGWKSDLNPQLSTRL